MSRDFDDVTRDLIELLRNRYVILYNHLNLLNVLQYELSPVQYFDVNSCRLVRNENMRDKSSIFPSTLSTVVPLALYRKPLLGGDVPAFGRAHRRWLLDMFNRVRFNLPPILNLSAPHFEFSGSYRSTVYNWLPLESLIAEELLSDLLLRSRVLGFFRPLMLLSLSR